MNKFFDALRILIKKLEGVEFSLVGSYNLYLQGIDIKPHDLDLLSDDEGIDRIGEIFGSEVKVNEFGYKISKFVIDGVDIHIVSNVGNIMRPPFRQGVVWIQKDGLKIPCASLTSELAFYEKVSREKDKGKIDLIREKLK